MDLIVNTPNDLPNGPESASILEGTQSEQQPHTDQSTTRKSIRESAIYNRYKECFSDSDESD